MLQASAAASTVASGGIAASHRHSVSATSRHCDSLSHFSAHASRPSPISSFLYLFASFDVGSGARRRASSSNDHCIPAFDDRCIPEGT